MPVTYHIDEALHLVYVRWEGTVPMAEALAYADQLRADPSFEPDMAQISDARGVQMDGLTGPDALRDLALKSPLGSGSRRAIVVDKDVMFGVSRMYEAFAHDVGPEIKVFRDMDAAHRWLGLDDGTAAAGTD
jgi:hypothetical protein